MIGWLNLRGDGLKIIKNAIAAEGGGGGGSRGDRGNRGGRNCGSGAPPSTAPTSLPGGSRNSSDLGGTTVDTSDASSISASFLCQ